MGGVQTQILIPPLSAPRPWEVQFVEVVRTTFGPTWSRRRRIFFVFDKWWGLKICFTLCVYAQNAQILWAIQMCMQKGERFFPRPSPQPPPPKSGCLDWTPSGQIFFKNPTYVCSK